jgi:hypothetical protein
VIQRPRTAAWSRALLAILAVLAPCAQAQLAAGPLLDGLLRTRDLSAFGVLRLDMLPAHALKAAPGTWTVEASVGYQNTWSMSPNVEEYIQGRGMRRRIGPAQVAAIRALPDGDKFLFDFELGVVDVMFHRRLDENWSLYAQASAIAYTGGFMDGPIENFHRTVGYRDYVRPALQRDRFAVVAELQGAHLEQFGAPSGGLLDPSFGARYETASRYAPWNFIVEGALKAPLGGTRAFLSNGNVDLGLQATVQRTFGRHAAHAAFATVYTRDGGLLGPLGRSWVPTATVGYEYAFGPDTALVGQVRASRNAIDASDTDLRAVLKTQVQAAAGIRHRVGASVFTLGFNEHLGSFNAMPDLQLHLGWTYAP